MTSEERRLIRRWVAAGAPEGDRAQLPPPPEFPQAWRLPRQPDLVLKMRKAPFRVAAEGNVNYQHFEVDPGFREDKWVQGIEVLPGNRAVVHHILVYVMDGRSRFGQGEGYLGVYVPGMKPQVYPPGMAKLVPAGSKLLFQLHYTPVGTPQEDLSFAGLIFAKPDEVTHAVVSGSVGNTTFFLPAGEARRVEATSPPLVCDVQLLSLMPHMHFRGKSFRYELREAGRSEVLLDVPHYDFNWQTSYELAEARPLKKGAQIHCLAVFDNSADNAANPNPDVMVRFGPQADDEMMFGYLDYAVSREAYVEISRRAK
jgi:hypothetical protein